MQPGWKARPARLPDLVGPDEIATRLVVQRATVDQWRHRQILPAPDWPLHGGPVWLWATIAEWAHRTGRGSMPPP